MLPSYAPVSFSLSVLSSVYFEILKKKGGLCHSETQPLSMFYR